MVKEIADLQSRVEGQDRELAVLRQQLDTLRAKVPVCTFLKIHVYFSRIARFSVSICI